MIPPAAATLPAKIVPLIEAVDVASCSNSPTASSETLSITADTEADCGLPSESYPM